MSLADAMLIVRDESMRPYRVGFIYTRCFIQKRIVLRPGVQVIPLSPTGFSGDIHDSRSLLGQAGFSFTRKDIENTLENFKDGGQSVVVKFENLEAKGYISAIENVEAESEAIVGALSVTSANPGIPLCAFAGSDKDSGVKYYFPPDRIIKHGTNIHGYLDAIPDIEQKARNDAKYSLLLKLYRASLREKDIDHQILFQLILLEEASDSEVGSSFSERLRNFSEKNDFSGDLAAIAAECRLSLPPDKDVIDVIVKLRNAATHNGKIDEAGLREYKGGWVIPLLSDKPKLYKVIGEAIRYMFCSIVGHMRDVKATKITGNFEVRFD